MKTFFRILLLIAFCFSISIGAYFWATGLISSNYAYRSVLKNEPPLPGNPIGEPITDRVVFVLIDALRYDTSINSSIMPTLNKLREIGAYARMHSQPPSYSEPGYTTLLTGAWPEINDGPVLNLEYDEIPAFTQDDLFSAVSRSGQRTALSGYNWFQKLIPADAINLGFFTPGEDRSADRLVVTTALPWLKDDLADLILIHIDQVDYAGHHEGGANSAAWDQAASRSDALLKEIVESLDLTRDTIVVLSDHGQIDAGGHGGQEPVVLLEPFVIAGKGVIPGDYGDINMVDVAPTLAVLLGANIPASAQGMVLTEILTLSSEMKDFIRGQSSLQQEALVTAYAKAVGRDDQVNMPQKKKVMEYQSLISKIRSERLFLDRIPRAALVAILLGIILIILKNNQKFGSKSWILAGVMYLVLFNARYALIDKKTYSMSSVVGETELILYIGITAIASLLIAWFTFSILYNAFLLPPKESTLFTLRLGLTVAFIVALPVLLSYVLNGALVSWTLPDYLTSYLALIGLIQVLIICAITPLLAGVSALVSQISNSRNNYREG